MKTSFLVRAWFLNAFFLLALPAFLLAQAGSRHIYSLQPTHDAFILTDISPEGFIVEQSISQFGVETLERNGNTYFRLQVPGFGINANAIGNPELPAYHRMLEIPFQASWEIEIIEQTYELVSLTSDFPGMELFPVQPSVGKHEDENDLTFYRNDAIYESNQFYAEDIIEIESLGTMRGVGLGRLAVQAFAYQPQTGTIKVLSSLKFKVRFVGADYATTSALKRKYFSPTFETNFKTLINYSSSSKELISQAPVVYQIISDPMFAADLEPFILWKTQKGFQVQIAYTNDPNVGTSTASIQSYLSNLYTQASPSNPAPSFVLLVGDVQQIPAFAGTAGSHVSDLYYFCYDGASDYFPDIYYGRFSAQNIAQLQPQIEKTLEYEKYLMPDPSFLNEVVLVAGVDASYAPTHGNGQINYAVANYFNTTNGFTTHSYLYPASGSSATQIRQDVSNGVGFANYTAHCNSDGWADPSFVISHVPALQNVSQYPLMIGNCCLSSKFDDSECFGEAVLRANKKGAIGYIGGSNNTYWNEDFWFSVGHGTVTANPTYAQTGIGFIDAMFHLNGEPLSEWYITNGQIQYAGNLAVTAGGSSLVKYYWEIYHLMGDPSLTIYQGVPTSLVATYSNGLPLGATQLAVQTEEHAYIGLSKDSMLIAAAMAGSGGLVNLTFPPLSEMGDYQITITKQNRQPHVGQIQVFAANTPYVTCQSLSIQDPTGNQNGYADFSETIYLTPTLQNLGGIDATGLSIVCSSTDAAVTITQSSASLSGLLSQESADMVDAFELEIGDSIIDEQVVQLVFTISDNAGNTWESYGNLTLYAPLLSIEEVQVLDTPGNQNGRLDAGEVAYVSYLVKNIGHATYSEAITFIDSQSPYLSVISAPQSLNNLTVNSSDTLSLLIEIDPTAPINAIADLSIHVDAGFYSKTAQQTEGIQQIVEDWESNSMESFAWLNDSPIPWTIQDSEFVDGSFAARSGDISNNQSTSLELTIDVAQNDSISFHYFVSCEPQGWAYYDYLEFFIDNVSKGKWAGEIDWERAAFPITQGTHNLKWVYQKDGYVVEGQDLAIIDKVVFPPLTEWVSNTPPHITSVPDTIVWTGDSYHYELAASDADQDDLEMGFSMKPAFLQPGTQTLQTLSLDGTPGWIDLGNHWVVSYVSDGKAMASQYFVLQVKDNNAIADQPAIQASVFPNPASHSLQINWENSSIKSPLLRVFNAQGQQIDKTLYSESIPSNQSIQLSVEFLVSGLYFIELETEKSTTKIPFIKQ